MDGELGSFGRARPHRTGHRFALPFPTQHTRRIPEWVNLNALPIRKGVDVASNVCYLEVSEATEPTAHKGSNMNQRTPHLVVVIDIQTGLTVYTTTYANRNRARRVADRKNLAYGAHRYARKVVFS